jgi:hypothetical protein
MKNLLLILLLSSSALHAEIKMDKKLKAKLENTLNDIKKFKQDKNYKIHYLNNELSNLKKKFASYKSSKEHELKHVKSQLVQTQKKLSVNQVEKNALIGQMKVQLVEKQAKLEEMEPVNDFNVDKAIAQALNELVEEEEPSPRQKMVLKKKPVDTKVETMVLSSPSLLNTPWVEIEVSEDMSIYDLAKLYYGDRSKYKEIYAANMQTIPDNLVLNNGMSLNLPMTSDFKEQPIVLNTH